MSNKKETAIDSIEFIQAKTDEIILMCSLGKDSLVLLDMLYPKFKRIVCVFMYFVKGLKHIQRWIDWVQARYPNIEFVQVPHWTLSYILRSGLYCTPNPNVKARDLKDVCKAMRVKYGIDYIFLGMKRADSANRRLFIETYRSNHFENNGMVYPLADWTQKDVLSYMRMHNLPEPIRYSEKASGGVGMNEEFFLWCEKNAPEDLEKIYKVFPLTRRILAEYHYKEK